jgi:hypothetical protein
MTDFPTPDQVKDTVEAGQQAWAAIEHFVQVASWVGPWVVTISAGLTAASRKIQDVPFFGPLLNTLGLNVGAAKNRG